jgi:3-phenylpropionate/trans-cinnamate dioxygenase ferredoxin subunit
MMSQWQDVARVDAFREGSVEVVDLDDGRQVAVFSVGGKFYALEDRCSHEDENLSCGIVDGDEIVCLRHGAHFSLLTGAALTPPAYEPVATFPVRVEGGIVQVDAGGGD